MTLQTIADHVGVSRMTVSNAFSKPDQLSTGLRQRILAAAAELGYGGPDAAARALARGSTGTVGVLLTGDLRYAFTDEVATNFLGAIVDELAPTGLALTLLPEVSREDVTPARDVAMDGALVYSCNPELPALDVLRRRRIPLVYVDQVPTTGVASVNVEDRSGAREAAQHLLDLGHRDVGIITLSLAGPHGVLVDDADIPAGDAHVSSQRLLGWRDALAAAGVRPRLVRQRHCRVDEAYGAARVLLDRPDRPTAVLCFSDAIAQGVVHVAEDLGLRVPDDLSVVGFDDNPLAHRMRPALTTVRQDLEAKGRAAAAALTTAIEAARSGTPEQPRQVTLPTELVIRTSTAPAPAHRTPAS
ncbi:LacI family DNA-binding transcriptional regulator [Plantactinospora sp. KBS50]|uniref:LacI family DNA-binding transcriptional regulator n=1 Tax=Plantactinospora sp. KBS50 TaxID=2024580 RepID=UPI001E336D62|nr:LacI family DNA-binding transcriptional regulator [Plantactinospora sp. KBS50]